MAKLITIHSEFENKKLEKYYHIEMSTEEIQEICNWAFCVWVGTNTGEPNKDLWDNLKEILEKNK